MSSGHFNFENNNVYRMAAEHGAEFVHTFTHTDNNGDPIAMTAAWTGSFRIKASYDSDVVLLEASTANGKMVITPAIAGVDIDIPRTEVSAVPAGRFVYTYKLNDENSDTFRFMEGEFEITKEA